MQNEKNKTIRYKREMLNFAMLIYFLFLFAMTIIPNGGLDYPSLKRSLELGQLNLVPFKVIPQTIHMVFIEGQWSYFLINFLGNIAIFMPIGFSLLLYNSSISYKCITLTGMSISSFIEIFQLFIHRGTDIDDVILNTLGAILGFCICKSWLKNKQK